MRLPGRNCHAAWKETCRTLHLSTQIVGKIRLAQTPWLNHSWHVTLYVAARGLTTSPIPHGTRQFQIDFDFIDHVLWLRTNDGHARQLMLKPISVAEFYADVLRAGRARLRHPHQRDPMRSQTPLLQRRPRTLSMTATTRTGFGASCSSRTRCFRISARVPRQGESGAFLLGQFRSR